MNFIIEASGASDALPKVDEAEQLVESAARRRYHDDSGKPRFVTRENVTKWVGEEEARKVDMLARLRNSYSKEQLKEMNTTGYTVLTNEQLHMFYGPDSPYNNSEALAKYSNLTRAELEEFLEHDIRLAAEMESFNVRKNDIVASPFLFATVTGPAGSAVSQLPFLSF
ncbi:hypothetical protein L596_026766 [Steinernema carpocapsae]|uniref:Uncharacterized protein n=1 Tax=Steinernema carpocapsae TaxID=34508 RepID=A0A4U5M2B1_STECR|nr:hypothetical protein L596_026766 [Steinernema carpocapsae]